MRKIYLFMMVTVDGYFEGTNHEIDWHNVDKEFVGFSTQQLDDSDVLVFGHRTYDMMASFWTSEKAVKSSAETAQRMNSKHKIVFSTTLEKADWENTEIKRSVNRDEINKLKEMPGKDIVILGSSNLCISFLKEKLLDELRIMVNPVVLGKGNTLFNGLMEKVPLKLTSSRTFANGNILLTYQVVK